MTYVLQNPYQRKAVLHLQDGSTVEISEFQLRALLVMLYSKSNIKRKAVTWFNSYFGVKKTFKFWRKTFQHVQDHFNQGRTLKDKKGVQL
tara:strand:+ start:237 stop:506 length:270 start_codon:yes stop_codon:yes gene_type:complete